jgi:uncharacterized protein YqjF (DUF2071 family)
MIFLAAEWNDLLLANYSVEPDRLAPYVPKGTSVDLFEGHAFVSLVAFMFNRTRVLGVPVPGHIDFEEVNLRFYVKPDYDESIRAVAFIKEIVPRAAIPIVANALFNENYEALKMHHERDFPHISYSWERQRTHTFSATVETEPALPQKGSIGEFITEHYWGYAEGRNATLEYQVEHPQWQCADVTDYNIDIDFDDSYGPEFAFLNALKPHNVQYAKGSPVTVSSPRKI